MFTKNVPNMPIKDHNSFVLILLESSNNSTTSIMEKMNMLSTPTQFQMINKGKGPFQVCSVIMPCEPFVTLIPKIFKMPTIRLAKKGTTYEDKYCSSHLDKKGLEEAVTIKKRGVNAFLRDDTPKNVRHKPKMYVM